jgi:hypothetical protein
MNPDQMKYLLYIDILGFRDIVKNTPQKAHLIHDIMNKAFAQNHGDFKTLVFSDTMISYNLFKLNGDKSMHEHALMFLCEFAQDLLYSLSKHNIFFRGIIDYGVFEHRALNNMDSYFGNALINCYELEKNIPSMGLFITKQANKYQNIFKTACFSEETKFVYLQTHLDSLVYDDFLVPFSVLEQTTGTTLIEKEFNILQKIYEYSNSHINPIVRSKYLLYWYIQKKQYPFLFDKLVSNDFNVNRYFNDI